MNPQYPAPMRHLHWLMATLLVLTLLVGIAMTAMPLSPSKLQIYAYHKWLGVSLWLLVVIRLVVRGQQQRRGALPPPLPAPRWQQQAASAVHGLLYLLLLAIPLSGWLMSSAKGFSTVYLGVLPLPDLLLRDKALGDALQALHQTLNAGLAGLVLLHLAAALKHHWIDRDTTLQRMWPGVSRPTPAGILRTSHSNLTSMADGHPQRMEHARHACSTLTHTNPGKES